MENKPDIGREWKGEGGGVAFTVRIVTRAQRNEIAGIQEDSTIKIRLTVSPSEGQANDALIKFLAQRLGVAENAVEIVAGRDKRDKLVTVQGINTARAERLLQPDPDVSDKD